MTEQEARDLGIALKADGYTNLVKWSADLGWRVEVQRRDGFMAESMTMLDFVEKGPEPPGRLLSDKELEEMTAHFRKRYPPLREP